jgi:sugar lactone lactonase YvrE
MDVVVDGLTFAEAPRWRDGKLWFSDFYTYRVLTVDLAGHVETVAEVPQRPSGLGWTADGALLVVSMLDRRLLRFDGGRSRVVADLSSLATGPCNDMVVDGAGRAYVGNFGFDRHLTAFDVAGDGSLSNRRLFAQLEECFPDGICLDVEGAVWVADARNPRVIRVFDGGRIERTVSTGERFAFACMLGGLDWRTLFVCTNTGSGPAMAEKTDGRIEAIRVQTPGAGWP